MAISGIFYGSTSNQYIKPKIQWWAQQSEEGNYSDVTAVLTYSRTNTYAAGTEGEWSGSLTIGDVTRTGWVEYLKITYNSNTEAIRNTVRVYHDEYGCRSLTIQAQGHVYPTSLTQTDISQTVELDSFLRASAIGATPTNIGEATAITLRKKSEDCLHSIQYRFGTLEGYIGKDWKPTRQEQLLADSAISFVIPEEFYGQIPESPSGVCTLTCRTYKDGQLVGTPQEAEFTVTADPEKCRPQLQAWVKDTQALTLALTGDENILIRGKSAALCQAQVDLRQGAYLKKLTVNDRQMAGDLLLEGPLTGEFVFRAEDSRGYSCSLAVSKVLIPYAELSCNPQVKRTDPTSGNGILTVSGSCFAGSFGARENRVRLYCRVNGGQSMELPVELTEDGYTVYSLISGLDYNAVSTVEVVAEDDLSTVAAACTVQKGIPVFDWGENDFAFHVPVAFHGGIAGLGQLVYPVGSIYLSVAQTQPELLFGGIWERLQDVFLLASGERFLPGSTGGEAEHTLSLEEIPSHSHTVEAFVQTNAGDGAFDYYRNNLSDHAAQTAQAGGGQAHNNMPPYLAVYAWKRTA